MGWEEMRVSSQTVSESSWEAVDVGCQSAVRMCLVCSSLLLRRQSSLLFSTQLYQCDFALWHEESNRAEQSTTYCTHTMGMGIGNARVALLWTWLCVLRRPEVEVEVSDWDGGDARRLSFRPTDAAPAAAGASDSLIMYERRGEVSRAVPSRRQLYNALH